MGTCWFQEKDVEDCDWVFTKYQSDGPIECLKAQLVAKGHTQTCGVNYFGTLSYHSSWFNMYSNFHWFP